MKKTLITLFAASLCFSAIAANAMTCPSLSAVKAIINKNVQNYNGMYYPNAEINGKTWIVEIDGLSSLTTQAGTILSKSTLVFGNFPGSFSPPWIGKATIFTGKNGGAHVVLCHYYPQGSQLNLTFLLNGNFKPEQANANWSSTVGGYKCNGSIGQCIFSSVS
jgi:hypothetical protein